MLDLPHLLQLERKLLVKRDVTLGLYRHYKGGLYVVLGVGLDSETREASVVYYSLAYRALRLRPLGMFREHVRPDRGEEAPVAAPDDPRGVPRFRRVLPPLGLLDALADLTDLTDLATTVVRSVLRLRP